MALHLKRFDLKPYLVSFLSVITAAILTVAIEPFFGGKAPLFFLTIAVILSAAFGGMAAGLLATALSVGVVLSVLRDKSSSWCWPIPAWRSSLSSVLRSALSLESCAP